MTAGDEQRRAARPRAAAKRATPSSWASSASSPAGSSGQVAHILDAWGRIDARRARARRTRRGRCRRRRDGARRGRAARAVRARRRRRRAATPLEIVRQRLPRADRGARGRRRSRRSSATSSPSGPGPTTATGWCSHGLGDLGDPDLAPLQMAWGMAKAKVLRADARADGDLTTLRVIDELTRAVISVCSLT